MGESSCKNEGKGAYERSITAFSPFVFSFQPRKRFVRLSGSPKESIAGQI